MRGARLVISLILAVAASATRASGGEAHGAGGAWDADEASSRPPAPVPDAQGATRRDHVVAHVGPLVISVGAVEDALGALPAFQLAAYGKTVDEVRRRVLDEVIIPDALVSERALLDGLESQPPAAYRIERARSAATVRAIRRRVGKAASISMDDVRGYYEAHRERYEAPAHYLLWRILCKTKQEAQDVLEAAEANPTPTRFTELARDHSVDKGSFLRGGDLGFVADDGTTAEPDLRVDPAVVKAAASVRDGDFVPVPTADGDYFAVIWRRGTRPALSRPIGAVADGIREILRDSRLKAETDALVARLRAARLRDLSEAPLDALELTDPEPAATHGSAEAAAETF